MLFETMIEFRVEGMILQVGDCDGNGGKVIGNVVVMVGRGLRETG